MLTANGWVRQTPDARSIADSPSSTAPVAPPSSSDLAQVETDNVILSSTGTLTASVYNPSLQNIDGEVICIVDILEKESNHLILSERLVRTSVHFPSRQSEAFSVETGIRFDESKQRCSVMFEQVGYGAKRQMLFDQLMRRGAGNLRQQDGLPDPEAFALRRELVRRGTVIDNSLPKQSDDDSENNKEQRADIIPMLRKIQAQSEPTQELVANLEKLVKRSEDHTARKYDGLGVIHTVVAYSDSHDGLEVGLDDGSLWETSPSDTSIAQSWTTGTEVTVLACTDGTRPYKLVNVDDGKAAHVKWVDQ
jgi:hypothetical protein